ncbi:MAG: hypothetical protein ACAH24_08050 [Hyphomicrobiaceae bacterium]|jgi:hypothetical protein
MTVVPFRRVQTPTRAPRPTRFTKIEPPPALTADAGASVRSLPDPAEDRQRMRENLAALAVVVVLLLFGAWLIERLSAYSRTLACIEFGHRSCLKLDVGQLPPR